MDRLLIDTDVILDFLFDRKPFSDHATEVMTLCENETITGFVTPVIISNVYYLLRRVAPHRTVIEKLKQLLLIIDVLEMDKEIVLNAINSGFADFEDALQYFSAAKNGNISIILTRNVKDYKRSSLAVLTPELYLQGINN